MKININDKDFLNKENDITHKGIVEIASAGEFEESTKFKNEKTGEPAKQFTIDLKIATGEIKSTILSFGNLKLLGEAFGDETDAWVGKQVRAWKTKSEKAKTGYVYLYVDTSWDRDDTGEWVKPVTAPDIG